VEAVSSGTRATIREVYEMGMVLGFDVAKVLAMFFVLAVVSTVYGMWAVSQ
jgi:hypothetical protein